MATPPADQPATDAISTPSAPQPTASPPTSSSNAALLSSPVELKTLPASVTQAPLSATNTTARNPESAAESASIEPAKTQTGEQNAYISPAPPADPSTPPASLNRAESEAIGPSTDIAAASPDTTHGPVVVIMLLLISGARHPYKIDERYLKKRNVTVESMDPYNLSVYTLKELIWRDWREEWETRPTSPTSIRLIHFGRMLDDKAPLRECRFQTEAPNVVHMTVRPPDTVDEEDAKTGKGGGRRDADEESHAGCRCTIL